MGLFDKAKQFLNIGGVKLRLLDVPPDISRASGSFTGKVSLSSKSDQHVKSVKATLNRKITTYLNNAPVNQPNTSTVGQQNNTRVREDVLGTWAVSQPFDMKAGEEKKMDFEVKFNEPAPGNMNNNAGGVSIGNGQFSINIGGGANRDREEIEYRVNAVADVDKVALDPSDSISVRVV